MTNPFEQYKQTSVNTMTNGELLITLYDELVKKLTQAKMLMENNDYDNANKALEKCRKIFNYLIVTLDDKYELSSQLRELYSFFIAESIKASAMKSIHHIDNILPIITELRDTWKEADKIARTKK